MKLRMLLLMMVIVIMIQFNIISCVSVDHHDDVVNESSTCESIDPDLKDALCE